MHTGLRKANAFILGCVVTNESATDTVRFVAKNDRMIALREAKGWNQFELAAAAGSTQGTISRIERGETKTPEPETQKAIARALGTTTLDLFGAAAIDAPLPPPPDQPALQTTRVDVTTQLERIIAKSTDAELEDIDAAREAARRSALYLSTDTDLHDLSRWYLAASKRLRLDGRDLDPVAIITLAMVMRSSTSARVIELQSKADNEAGAGELAALRGEKP